MANPTTVGYLITIDGTTIINHSTLRAINTVQNAATAYLRTFVIPSGTKINYDGTSDSNTTPGRMSQEIICYSGGATLYGTLVGKQANYVTSVLSPLTGADLTNTGTIIAAVDDITPRKIHGTGVMHIRITIEVVGNWA